jgi:hypothetical protein
MPKFRVTCWYPMEGEVVVDATDEEDAKRIVQYAPGIKVQYEDTGDFFIKEVVELDDTGEEVEE